MGWSKDGGQPRALYPSASDEDPTFILDPADRGPHADDPTMQAREEATLTSEGIRAGNVPSPIGAPLPAAGQHYAAPKLVAKAPLASFAHTLPIEAPEVEDSTQILTHPGLIPINGVPEPFDRTMRMAAMQAPPATPRGGHDAPLREPPLRPHEPPPSAQPQASQPPRPVFAFAPTPSAAPRMLIAGDEGDYEIPGLERKSRVVPIMAIAGVVVVLLVAGVVFGRKALQDQTAKEQPSKTTASAPAPVSPPAPTVAAVPPPPPPAEAPTPVAAGPAEPPAPAPAPAPEPAPAPAPPPAPVAAAPAPAPAPAPQPAPRPVAAAPAPAPPPAPRPVAPPRAPAPAPAKTSGIVREVPF